VTSRSSWISLGGTKLGLTSGAKSRKDYLVDPKSKTGVKAAAPDAIDNILDAATKQSTDEQLA
jgi:hypothetical protein